MLALSLSSCWRLCTGFPPVALVSLPLFHWNIAFYPLHGRCCQHCFDVITVLALALLLLSHMRLYQHCLGVLASNPGVGFVTLGVLSNVAWASSPLFCWHHCHFAGASLPLLCWHCPLRTRWRLCHCCAWFAPIRRHHCCHRAGILPLHRHHGCHH